MAKITFIQPDGEAQTVEIPVGWSVMEGAVRANVAGIDADCGGACACATCHVQVEPQWAAKLPPKSEMEETMLDFAIAPKAEQPAFLPVARDFGDGRPHRARSVFAALTTGA